jgi:tetratricopeptide (TPR) repeat protein
MGGAIFPKKKPMPLDPYAPCPCGSGKKFKWCCQPIHVDIDKAFQQEAAGQMEAALRSMEQVTLDHPANPEAWGRKAELLYNAGRTEEAEAALQKAFDINPTYPFGFLLRGSFRRAEGEIPGALLLFRKAAEHYDPEAKDLLAQIYTLIFDCEMKLNHPVAARAAAQLALRFNPSAEDLRQGVDSVFGPKNPNLIAAAKQEYKYLPTSSGTGERRAAWEAALPRASTGKLGDAARAFQKLTEADPNDAPAWYNLALTQAWLGNSGAAVEALDKYVALESDEERAAQAWTLAEVLRLGQGMEDVSDYVEYSVTLPLHNPQAFVEVLGKLDQDGLLAGVSANQEQGVLTGVVLEKPGPALTAELAARQAPRLGAYLYLAPAAENLHIVRLWSYSQESLDRAHRLIKERAGSALADGYPARGPAKFFDVLSECLIFPRLTSEAELEARMREHLQKFLEETWIHRPLKSLGQVTPLDAVGSPNLRKKLRGVVRFLEECAELTKFPYDFGRLRRKLHLQEGAPAPTQDGQANPDISAMATQELAGLTVDTMTDVQLDEAFVAALKLDARELAAKFAQALTSRPARADKPDRYPLFSHLVTTALAQGDSTAALNHLNEGEKDDCEHNEGKRRNDYELRRGQILAKSGDVGQARDVFDRLIARVPAELKVRGAAAEAMLSAKEPGNALAYAEGGLAEARKQNHRDSEGYFMELAGAARKQRG